VRTLLLLACCGWWAGAASAAPRSPASITICIRVSDPDAIPQRILAKGESTAGYILQAAGVNAVWLHCLPKADRDPCRERSQSGDLWLHLLRLAPVNLRGEPAGFAVRYSTPTGRDGYAAVSYPFVRRVAAELGQDEGEILGAVMTHEIGHLLLSSSGHLKGSVMSPHFGWEEMRLLGRGELLFTTEQAAEIRAETERRELLTSSQPE
jgi:hypothetical protein